MFLHCFECSPCVGLLAHIGLPTSVRNPDKKTLWSLAVYKCVVLLGRKIPPETQQKLLLQRKIFIYLAMSLMTKITLVLTINDTMTHKCYSVSRSAINENGVTKQCSGHS